MVAMEWQLADHTTINRGWTNTWQGVMTSPTNDHWEIKLDVDGERLLCYEELSGSDYASESGSNNEDPPPKRFCKGKAG